MQNANLNNPDFCVSGDSLGSRSALRLDFSLLITCLKLSAQFELDIPIVSLLPTARRSSQVIYSPQAMSPQSLFCVLLNHPLLQIRSGAGTGT